MATVSTYLNFERDTGEAFEFYKSVFGAEYAGPITRPRDVPVPDGQQGPSDEDKDLIMNVALPILGGHLLMGTDAPASMGFSLNKGNNVYISLHPDSREEADTLFAALSDGAKIEMPMENQFWGDYFGSLVDKFGVGWMVNYSGNA